MASVTFTEIRNRGFATRWDMDIRHECAVERFNGHINSQLCPEMEQLKVFRFASLQIQILVKE